MGSLSGINFHLTRRTPVPVILDCLLKHGWTFDDQGKISHLPIGDVGAYSWQQADLALGIEFVYDLLMKKQQRNEIGGVQITWRESQTGGDLLLYPDEMKIQIGCSINHVTFEGSRVTDFGWYLKRLAIPFEDARIPVELIRLFQAF